MLHFRKWKKSNGNDSRKRSSYRSVRPLSAESLESKRFKNYLAALLLSTFAMSTLAVAATVPEREIQFRTINFDTDVIELHNFGALSVDLSGWRFCSHDEDQVRRYTGKTGLNGQSIAAGESLFVHVNNDATGSSEINLSSLGGTFASPFDTGGAFGLNLYFDPVSFGNGATIADHIQWSIGGVDNASADERSDEAEAGGVWTDQSSWISVAVDTSLITLTDATGAELHSPANYLATVPEPGTLCLASMAAFAAFTRRRR